MEKTTKILTSIKDRYKIPTDFDMKPKKSFYEKIGINQKRYGQILKGTTIANAEEIKALSVYFGIDVNDLL